MRFPSTLSLALWASLAQAQSVLILVQSSPLAGSQYHALAEVASQLSPGERLTLVREPGNRHDPHAIRVEWRGHKLGYVPRRENRPLAAALDRGEKLGARVSRLTDSTDPWRRLEFEVYAEL